MALTALDMMKGWVEDLSAKNRALEEEIKTLKCTNVKLTEELEIERKANGKNNSVNNVGTQVDEVNLNPEYWRNIQSETDVNVINGQQIPRASTSTGIASEREDTPETRRTSNSVSVLSLSMSSESAISPFGEIPVKEEPADEFSEDNLQTGTPSVEDDSEIDIKEEDVGYAQSKSKQDCDNSTDNPILADRLNGDQSSDIPIKHEIERSIQRMFHRADTVVSTTEPVSGDFATELGTGTNCELNRSSSSHSPTNVRCQEIVQPQVSSQPLTRQKEPYLTTRTSEKIHKCENCSAAFDTQFKLREHNKSHTRKKASRPSVHHKTPLKCSVCAKSFSTNRVLANHMKTHTEEKSSRAHQVDMLFSGKRSLAEKMEKVNSAERPKKQRKVETETEVCNIVEMSEVRDEIDSPCVNEVERNPLKIEKIMGLILSNLGKHDLLKARLVSRAWNNESLKVLRKSKFTRLLRGHGIKECLCFMTSNEPSSFIIPYHLDFYVSSPCEYMTRYDRILTSQVDSLCHQLDPQSVSKLSVTTFDTDWTEKNIKEIGLTEILALIAPGLKSLDFKWFSVKNDFLKNQVITFPNLKKLICNTSECESGRRGPGLTYISIIENSPDLEDLTLTHPCDLDSWPLKFNQLKSLTLQEMTKPETILNKILSSCGPPVLRELRIGFSCSEISSSAENKIVLCNILKSVSSTLRSLMFRGYSYIFPRNIGNLRFPKLPRLEHLGLEYNLGNTSRLEAENIDFNPENFPSLKSIELPICSISTPSPVQYEDDGIRIKFPNFIKLTLRVNDTDDPEKVNGPLEYLQQIFPTPSKLSLVNTGGHSFVNYVLYRILISNWSKSIQLIELTEFNQDYLGGIFDGLELIPRVSLEKWYGRLEESLRTEFQNTMKRMGVEFEKTENVDTHGSFTVRTVRRKQWNCQI